MSSIPDSVIKHPFVLNLRLEVRKIRQQNSSLERSLESKKEALLRVEKENADLRKQKKEAEKRAKESENKAKELEDELNLLKGVNEKNAENAFTFKTMVFGHGKTLIKTSDKKPGGQIGHPGITRKTPKSVDETRDVFLNTCPDCGLPLCHSNHFKSHTVEDIPELLSFKIKVTRYNVNEQYCPCCKKHVRAVPTDVIPGSRLGLNLCIFIIILRTACNQTVYQISDLVNILFGTDISPGGIQKIFHKARKYLGPAYDEILKLIQRAKIKHADETGWKTNGKGGYDWVFLTANEVYHTIRNTRGKGVPEEILGGKNCRKDSILVRDSYAGYKFLLCLHQRCWSHLLRIIRDKLALYPDSKELKSLYKILGNLFRVLAKTVSQPFEVNKRQKVYDKAWSILEDIINSTYSSTVAKKIQTRIKNDGKELLTALLYDGVPLTNNRAERAIRPMVTFRKVTGGSRSDDGAKTTAVIRSVVQTIRVRKQPLVSVLKEELLNGIRQTAELKSGAV